MAVLACALGLVIPAPSAFCLTQDEITAAAINTFNNKAATFSSEYYLNQYLNGVPSCCPKFDGSLLAWGETYLGIAHRAMYEATGDKQYLELLLDNAEVMYANRADRIAPPLYDQIRNTFMPAFVSFNQSQGALARQHSWLVHSAYVSHPVTFAIADIFDNPQLESQYGIRAAALLSDITETMDSFDPDFSMISGGRGEYYDPYFNFYAPQTSGTLPYNMQSAAGQTYIALWRATGEQRFYDRANALAQTLKTEMTPVSDRYRWRYGPFDSVGSTTDVSHAGLDVAFAIDAYEAGIVFEDTDIQRLVNTFRHIRQAPGFTETVSGSGAGNSANTRLVSTWLQLTRYDGALRQEMFPLFQSYWNTDCCAWPILGAGTFYESGQTYTEETAFQDSFDGLQLSPRWRRPADQSISDIWTAQTTGSQLVVSDIGTPTRESWVDILKTRDVDQDDTWEVTYEFSWDSADGGSDPLQAVQRFFVELRDDVGDLIAKVGINDGWHQQNGGRVIQLFDQAIVESSNSIGAADSASIKILSDASLGISEIYWDHALLLSVSEVADLKQVGMRFENFRHFNGGQSMSHFGSIAVDSLIVGETMLLPGDYNGDGIVNVADYTVWRDSLGAMGSGLPADGNGNGEIDGGDYEIWKNNFGVIAGIGASLSAVATVPEPAARTLLGLIFVGLPLGGSTRLGVRGCIPRGK